MPSFSRRQLFQLIMGSAFALSSLSSSVSPVFAADDKFVIACAGATPSLDSTYYPGASRVILSNNLVRPTGKAEDAPGQIVYLKGRVTDENCVPIANAIIDLWQANPDGEYRYATREELLSPLPLFAGTGRAVTNNLGEYNFVTLFPGTYGRNAPHMRLRITHPDYKQIDTSVYFKGDRRNAQDSRFMGLKPSTRQLVQAETAPQDPLAPDAGLLSTFNIVLKGATPFRSY